MKFVLLIATSLAATSPMASEQETFGNWMKIKAYDAKTQEISCGVVNIDGNTTGGPTLVFITNHKSQPLTPLQYQVAETKVRSLIIA